MATCALPTFTAAMFMDKITSVIYPQVLQLVNIRMTQYINTGDRIQDGLWVLIANTLVALTVSALYSTACFVWTRTSEWWYPPTINDVMDAEVLNATYTKDVVTKFSFSTRIHDPADFNNWVQSQKVVDYQLVSAPISLALHFNGNDFDKAGFTPIGNSYFHYPVYQYTVKDVRNYVYVYGNVLYSMHKHALEHVVVKYHKDTCASLTTPHTFIPVVQTYRSGGNVDTNGNANPKCTFDRIHFTQKASLMNWLEKFKTNTMYPDGLPMTNKFGVLLHGPPGTGKSGTVTAIATYLGRNILLVNTLIASGFQQSELVDAIHSRRKTHVIVFDEFDYMIKEETPPIDYRSLLSGAEGDERIAIIESIRAQKEAARSKVDLRFVLNLFDGVGDEDGRVFICCSNNPHFIPPVVIRPGRIDLVLELGYTTPDMFNRFAETIYPTIEDDVDADPDLKKRVETALQRNITPLTLINTLVTSTDVDQLLGTLTSLKVQSYDSKLDR